jgi:hypothetical protein
VVRRFHQAAQLRVGFIDLGLRCLQSRKPLARLVPIVYELAQHLVGRGGVTVREFGQVCKSRRELLVQSERSDLDEFRAHDQAIAPQPVQCRLQIDALDFIGQEPGKRVAADRLDRAVGRIERVLCRRKPPLGRASGIVGTELVLDLDGNERERRESQPADPADRRGHAELARQVVEPQESRQAPKDGRLKQRLDHLRIQRLTALDGEPQRFQRVAPLQHVARDAGHRGHGHEHPECHRDVEYSHHFFPRLKVKTPVKMRGGASLDASARTFSLTRGGRQPSAGRRWRRVSRGRTPKCLARRGVQPGNGLAAACSEPIWSAQRTSAIAS